MCAKAKSNENKGELSDAIKLIKKLKKCKDILSQMSK